MANTAKSDAYKHKKELEHRRLTKAKQEQLSEWRLMKEMGEALGIEVPKQIENNPLDKRQNTRIALTPGLNVVLSVRRSLYDLPFHFNFRSKSIMKMTAVMEAEKAARAEGLQILCTISADNEEAYAGMPRHLSLAEQALASARARL
jgi:uncharacterized NAD-dependent epimerase/dehydratase family protein